MAWSTLCFVLYVVMIFLTGVHAAPMITDEEEGPTALAAQPQLQDEIEHRFVAKLLECLKLRDARKSLSPCVPEVFSHTDDFPSSQAVNTIRTYIANTTLEGKNMTMALNVSEDKFSMTSSGVHLRIHKNSIAPEAAEQQQHCDISSGVGLTMSLVNDWGDKFLVHTSTILYDDLLKEMWLDFKLFEDGYNTDMNIRDRTVLHLELSVQDCRFLTIKTIGLGVEEGREPVLITYTKEQDVQMLSNATSVSNEHASQQKKRQADQGSGILADPEKCRLIRHKVSYKHLRATVPRQLQFELNYCTGHCLFPLPQESYSSHADIQAYLRLNEDEHSNLPSPCCVATKYLGLSFPIIESKWNYIILTLENVSANGCGCR